MLIPRLKPGTSCCDATMLTTTPFYRPIYLLLLHSWMTGSYRSNTIHQFKLSFKQEVEVCVHSLLKTHIQTVRENQYRHRKTMQIIHRIWSGAVHQEIQPRNPSWWETTGLRTTQSTTQRNVRKYSSTGSGIFLLIIITTTVMVITFQFLHIFNTGIIYTHWTLKIVE